MEVLSTSDLVHCILLQLDARGIGRAARVCRSWAAWSRDPRLWAHLVNSNWPGLLCSSGLEHDPRGLFQRLTYSREFLPRVLAT
jgi:hypothetical protein